MADVLSGVLTSVLGGAIMALSRRISVRVRAKASKASAQDRAVAAWFDTYELTEAVPQFDTDADQDRVVELISSHEVQALVHELLAVRLIEAPEAEVERLETGMRHVFERAGSTASLAERIFEYLDHEICSLVVRLDTTEDAFRRTLKQEANSARLNATLAAINRHLEALAGAPDPDQDHDFLKRYGRHCLQHHGKVQPPDFQRRRPVAIEKIYVPQSFEPAFEDGERRWFERLDLRAIMDTLDRTVILGDPGGGKSTTAQAITHRLAGNEDGPVPFLVVVREFAATTPSISIVDHIARRLEVRYQCPPPDGLLQRLFLSGRAVVIFDGLDEMVDTTRRVDVAETIEHFCTEYPLAKVLVTSRSVGYEQARLDPAQFECFRISAFNDAQVEQYISNWFRADEDTGQDEIERCVRDFLAESASVPELRSNPLMLALMCVLYRGEGSIPRDRASMYAECARLFYYRWDARRQIHIELDARHLVEHALRHLAYSIFTREDGKTVVTERELVAECTRYFLSRDFEDAEKAEEAAEQFVDFCRGRAWVLTDVGTTNRGEALYTFTHRTFMEYFTAAQLAGLCDTPEVLARRLMPRVSKGEWDVVGQLAIQIKSEASDSAADRFFRKMLDQRKWRPGGILAFLCRCLPTVTLSADVVRILVRRVLQRTFDEPQRMNEPPLPAIGLLLSESGDYGQIIADELGHGLERYLASGDDQATRLALHLAVLTEYWQGIVYRVRDTASGPWHEFASANLRRYHQRVEQHAERDPALALHLFNEREMDLSDLLSWHGLEILFRSVKMSPRRYRIPLGTDLILSAYSDHIDLVASAERHLEELAGHLRLRDEPPWLAHTDVDAMARFVRDPGTPTRTLSREVLTAVGFILCVMTETPRGKEVAEDIGAFPQLAGFRDLLLRRADPTRPAPELGAPADFERLFLAWANREISFVESKT